MPPTERTKPLSSLLTSLARKHKPLQATPPGETPDASAGATADIFHGDSALKEFVRAALIWESTTAKADAALRRIATSVVDINEFRVSLPQEMASIIGGGYPRVEERVLFMKAALGEVFRREQRLRLAHLSTASKKAALAYLGTLPLVPPYVSDRVALLCFGCHALPVDSRIGAVLVTAKVVSPTAPAEQSVAALLKQIKAGEAGHALALLQAAADELPVSGTRASPTKRGTKATPAGKPARAARPSQRARKPARKAK